MVAEFDTQRSIASTMITVFQLIVQRVVVCTVEFIQRDEAASIPAEHSSSQERNSSLIGLTP